MKAIFTIMKGNLRKGKSAFISVAILMFILSLTLTAVITVNLNASRRDADALKEAGFGDMIASVSDYKVESAGMTIDQLYDKIKSSSVVDNVNRYDCMYAEFKDLNGKATTSTTVGFRYDPITYHYKIFSNENDGVYSEYPELKDGEVCVPISYQTLFDCKVGDTFHLITDQGDKEFTVKYFFEDPFMGGSMMGIKTLLFTDHDLTTLTDMGYEAAVRDGKSKIQKGTFFDVFRKKDGNTSMLKFTQNLNKDSGITDYAWITLATSQSTTYMLLLVNIFSGVLIGFVVILLIITIIIIGHNISSSIELDYVNLGIYKALGVSQINLKKVLLLQYGIATVLGAILGIPVSIPIINTVNHMTRPITGLYVSNSIAFLPCILILAVILVLVELYTLIKVRKISQITPVRAITGGKEDVYFSSRLQAPIKKSGLNFWMAFRQLTSNGRQYISAMLITMMLTFFLVMTSGMCIWMGTDGSNLNGIFNCYDDDLEIVYRDPDLKDVIEQRISRQTEITHHYTGDSMYLNLNNCNIYCFIYSSAEGYCSILEGRSCQYDNEILITKFVAKDLGLQIGDTVTVTTGDKSADFVVSGLYQSSNDMGSNFSMLASGYERLTGREFKGTDLYKLADDSKSKEIADGIEADYEKESLDCYAADYNDIIEPILTATQGITAIVYLITIAFVAVIVVILCNKIFAREKVNIGILKSEGFSSARLRNQFAIRFMIVAAIGCLLGVFMVWGLSDFVMQFIFNFVGVSEVESQIPLSMYLIPIGFMLLLFYIFAFIIAGKIKHVKTRILITD